MVIRQDEFQRGLLGGIEESIMADKKVLRLSTKSMAQRKDELDRQRHMPVND